MLVEIQIGKLAEYIEEFNATKLENNIDILTDTFGISVPALDKKAKVNRFIKKFNLPMVELTLNNGYTIKVAKKHILQQNGNDIFADKLSVGDKIDHLNGGVRVTKIRDVENENCFDIAIDAPHLYYDANGLVHHNTIMSAVLSHSVEAFGRSIVIVPNISLVTQTEADYINMGLDVGVYFGGRKESGRTHTICTWQSLNVLLKNTKAGQGETTIGEFLEGVVCVIVDEVHQAKADALKTLLTGVMSRIPIRWGLTGTIPKAKFEAQALLVSLGPVINKLAASELQEQGVLANCHVNIIQLQDKVEYTNYQQELKYLVSDDTRMTAIASEIAKVNRTGNTLVLVDRIEAGEILLSKLAGYSTLKDDVVFVSGGTKSSTRTEQYEDVATATNKIIIATYGVAAVGINIPRLFNVVLIEPGKSFVRTIQSIGRGLRMAHDKSFVQITDITSSCKFSKRHLTQRKAFYKDAKYPFDVTKVNYK